MTFVSFGIRTFDRMRREHALLLACACGAILLISLLRPPLTGGALSSFSNNSTQPESAIDSALQQAAEMRRVSTLRLAKCVWTSVWMWGWYLGED